MQVQNKHYYKHCPYPAVDVYRVLMLFGVTDPCCRHAIKKLLCAGQRGSKTAEQDIREARDTLNRRIQMYAEDGA